MSTQPARPIGEVLRDLAKHANARTVCKNEGREDTARWHMDHLNRYLDELSRIRDGHVLEAIERLEGLK